MCQRIQLRVTLFSSSVSACVALFERYHTAIVSEILGRIDSLNESLHAILYHQIAWIRAACGGLMSHL